MEINSVTKSNVETNSLSFLNYFGLDVVNKVTGLASKAIKSSIGENNYEALSNFVQAPLTVAIGSKLIKEGKAFVEANREDSKESATTPLEITEDRSDSLPTCPLDGGETTDPMGNFLQRLFKPASIFIDGFKTATFPIARREAYPIATTNQTSEDPEKGIFDTIYSWVWNMPSDSNEAEKIVKDQYRSSNFFSQPQASTVAKERPNFPPTCPLDGGDSMASKGNTVFQHLFKPFSVFIDGFKTATFPIARRDAHPIATTNQTSEDPGKGIFDTIYSWVWNMPSDSNEAEEIVKNQYKPSNFFPKPQPSTASSPKATPSENFSLFTRIFSGTGSTAFETGKPVVFNNKKAEEYVEKALENDTSTTSSHSPFKPVFNNTKAELFVKKALEENSKQEAFSLFSYDSLSYLASAAAVSGAAYLGYKGLKKLGFFKPTETKDPNELPHIYSKTSASFVMFQDNKEYLMDLMTRAYHDITKSYPKALKKYEDIPKLKQILKARLAFTKKSLNQLAEIYEAIHKDPKLNQDLALWIQFQKQYELSLKIQAAIGHRKDLQSLGLIKENKGA